VRSFAPILCCLSLCACVTSHPDHFYILNVQPPGESPPRTTPATPAVLKVTVPSWLDRPEMVINSSADAVVVLEHERWAAPLADLALQALARDLERRHTDVVIADPRLDAAGQAAVKIAVDLVQMTVGRGSRATLEAHWRIIDRRSGKEEIGTAVLSAPVAGEDYAAVAQAWSACLGLLADRVADQLP
jgi:uncharacterized lipoprotein YmbA